MTNLLNFPKKIFINNPLEKLPYENFSPYGHCIINYIVNTISLKVDLYLKKGNFKVYLNLYHLEMVFNNLA